jgi:NitT/TauT family transport system substrate-binding protein
MPPEGEQRPMMDCERLDSAGEQVYDGDMLLRIGHLSTFYHTAILLMARKDLAAGIGADVEWRLFGTGPAIMHAFSRGELDLAYIGLPPAIIGISAGTPVACVAGGHMEGTVAVGAVRRKGISELGSPGEVLRQFQGERVGVPGKGSIHDVILRDLLDKEGIAQAVEVVNFPWADLVTEAMARGDVSAAMGTPALAVAVMRFAGGKILIPPSRLWPDNPSYGIVVDRDLLAEKRQIVERFLALHEEALTRLRADPREAAEVIARHVGVIDADFVLDTLKISPRYCAQLTDRYLASTMRFVGTMHRLGYLEREMREEEIFDRSLIRTVHPGADHYDEGIRIS